MIVRLSIVELTTHSIYSLNLLRNSFGETLDAVGQLFLFLPHLHKLLRPIACSIAELNEGQGTLQPDKNAIAHH